MAKRWAALALTLLLTLSAAYASTQENYFDDKFPGLLPYPGVNTGTDKVGTGTTIGIIELPPDVVLNCFLRLHIQSASVEIKDGVEVVKYTKPEEPARVSLYMMTRVKFEADDGSTITHVSRYAQNPDPIGDKEVIDVTDNKNRVFLKACNTGQFSGLFPSQIDEDTGELRDDIDYAELQVDMLPTSEYYQVVVELPGHYTVVYSNIRFLPEDFLPDPDVPNDTGLNLNTDEKLAPPHQVLPGVENCEDMYRNLVLNLAAYMLMDDVQAQVKNESGDWDPLEKNGSHLEEETDHRVGTLGVFPEPDPDPEPEPPEEPTKDPEPPSTPTVPSTPIPVPVQPSPSLTPRPTSGPLPTPNTGISGSIRPLRPAPNPNADVGSTATGEPDDNIPEEPAPDEEGEPDEDFGGGGDDDPGNNSPVVPGDGDGTPPGGGLPGGNRPGRNEPSAELPPEGGGILNPVQPTPEVSPPQHTVPVETILDPFQADPIRERDCHIHWLLLLCMIVSTAAGCARLWVLRDKDDDNEETYHRTQAEVAQ